MVRVMLETQVVFFIYNSHTLDGSRVKMKSEQ